MPATPTSSNPGDFPPAVAISRSTEGRLSLKDLHRLQSIRSPLVAALDPPATRGRFMPRPLAGVSPGALDPRVAETFQFPSITPVGLRSTLTTPLLTEGFSISPDPAEAATRKLPKAGGFEISGTLLAERNLRADPAETRRRDRSRYAGVLAGASATGILGYVSLTHLSTLLGVLIVPAGLGVAVLLISLWSFENASYWSEIVVAQYTGQVAPVSKPTGPAEILAPYDVQLWVVRGQTQDWGTWGASGRNVVTGIPGEDLEPVRSVLRQSITAGAAPAPLPPAAPENSLARTALDALGQ
jgi:hypothetical protein